MLSSSFLVVVCVAVVVVVLVLPSWVARNSATGGPDQPIPPAPTQGPDEIGTRTWAATSCPGRGLDCRVPTSLDLGGARFVHVHGHRHFARAGGLVRAHDDQPRRGIPGDLGGPVHRAVGGV